MSKKLSREKSRVPAAVSHKKRAVIAITIALMSIACASLLAKVISPRKGQQASGDVSVASFGSPSKEYIYMGSRLIATEETAAVLGPGHDTTGLYNPAQAAFSLRNSNTGGAADVTFNFGPTGLSWVPLVGDWNGDGIDTIGLYDPVNGTFYLRNSNTGGASDVTFNFGPTGLGWVPLAGDWNGDGIDTIGLYDPVNAGFF